MALLTIACAQYPLDELPDLGVVEDKLARWVADAAGQGAQLLMFPEYGAMELAGPHGVRVSADLAASLSAVADAVPRIDGAHAELARRHRVHILAASGPVRGDDGRYRNSARLFSPSGASAAQEKMVMTPFERDWGIAPGTELRVFETSLGRIGIAICYDSEFPLLVRAQVEAGAELILVPSCTEHLSGWHRIRAAACARALEGTCVVAVSPTVGLAPWSPAIDVNTGAAGIYVPAEAGVSQTGVVAEGRRDAPGWVIGRVDTAALRRLLDAGEMRNRSDWHRQPGGALPLPPATVCALA